VKSGNILTIKIVVYRDGHYVSNYDIQPVCQKQGERSSEFARIEVAGGFELLVRL
jgi:hypothetical protein